MTSERFKIYNDVHFIVAFNTFRINKYIYKETYYCDDNGHKMYLILLFVLRVNYYYVAFDVYFYFYLIFSFLFNTLQLKRNRDLIYIVLIFLCFFYGVSLLCLYCQYLLQQKKKRRNYEFQKKRDAKINKTCDKSKHFNVKVFSKQGGSDRTQFSPPRMDNFWPIFTKSKLYSNIKFKVIFIAKKKLFLINWKIIFASINNNKCTKQTLKKIDQTSV